LQELQGGHLGDVVFLEGWDIAGNHGCTASLLGLLALAVLAWHSFRKPPPPAPNRLPELRRLVEQQEKESAEAFAAYTPKTQGRLDDLAVPAGPLLRQLLGVVKVEIGVRADKPTHRIVHLLDYHVAPADLYTIDLRQAAGRPLSEEKGGRLHEELCLEVEAVQLEQIALLRCLIHPRTPRHDLVVVRGRLAARSRAA
jgi:hypothetical protein